MTAATGAATVTFTAKDAAATEQTATFTIEDTTARPSTWLQQTLRLSATVRATQLTSTHGLPWQLAPALLMLAAV